MQRLKIDSAGTRSVRPIKLVPESVRRLRRPHVRVPFIRQPTPAEAPAEDTHP